MNATNIHETLSTAPAMGQPHSATEPGVRSAVFVDPASRHLLALAQRVAQAEVTTLLVGPTGAGKEVLARVLHEASPRARGPFVALNCAAMPEHLIEDLLFGHDKGAFTGAHRDHKGLFEQAQGGTLFLDEIGEMPVLLQSKLLRVLQERQLTRLGGQSTVALDVRVVAATNKDLRQAMAAREFREDLYYRIATFRLQLLALSQRRGDILPLAMQCLAEHARGLQSWHITPEAQQCLLQYSWPGNVRELENVMRRAMVLCMDAVITPAHLLFDDWLAPLQGSAEDATFAPALQTLSAQPQPAAPSTAFFAPLSPAQPLEVPQTLQTAAASLPLASQTSDTTGSPSLSNGGLHNAVRQNEHQIILAAIAAAPSRMEAARRLGISPRTLRYKLAQLRDQAMPVSAEQALSAAWAE